MTEARRGFDNTKMWQARQLGPCISVGWDPRLRYNSLKTLVTEDTELSSGILKAGAEKKYVTLNRRQSIWILRISQLFLNKVARIETSVHKYKRADRTNGLQSFPVLMPLGSNSNCICW